MGLVSLFQSVKYKYYVTLPLLMLTRTERCIFNAFLFTSLYLLCTAFYMYFPSHVKLIAQRVHYYYAGDYAAAADTSTLDSSYAI
ncbi:uncharacterized protein V2V93DRAFT_364850 [Kockiozyma suomiensis]|uniref:uncharacterized protein n=1 Tax=Kockiozyma suomiensis TaxID=1337062 RepID=UPI003343C97A